MLLDPFEFVWRALSVLASLIDHRGGQQLRGVEVAHGEALEPSLLPTREALKLRSPHVPDLDVDPVRATLAEEDDRHASIQTTLNIYTHVVDASHRKAIEAVERELFPSVPKSADRLADAVTVSDSVN